MMGIFEKLFNESKDKKLNRLRSEFCEQLKTAFSVPYDAEELDDILLITIPEEELRVFVAFAPYGDDEESDWRLTICCPLVFLPPKNILPFYRKLLDENGERDFGYTLTEDDHAAFMTKLPIECLTEESTTFYLANFIENALELRKSLIDEFSVQAWEPEE